jgi:hypothetical protein
MREVSGASVANDRVTIPFRAVAQLGRAPGSGQAPNEYAHVLPRALTCFFIGKTLDALYLKCSQMSLKNSVGV